MTRGCVVFRWYEKRTAQRIRVIRDAVGFSSIGDLWGLTNEGSSKTGLVRYS